jgi:hypothetical protein
MSGRVADTGTLADNEDSFFGPVMEIQMSEPGKTTSGVSRRGFASMTPERRREIARMGGAAVPEEKRSFSQDRDLARDAGRKGGAHGAKRKKGDA